MTEVGVEIFGGAPGVRWPSVSPRTQPPPPARRARDPCGYARMRPVSGEGVSAGARGLAARSVARECLLGGAPPVTCLLTTTATADTRTMGRRQYPRRLAIL